MEIEKFDNTKLSPIRIPVYIESDTDSDSDNGYGDESPIIKIAKIEEKYLINHNFFCSCLKNIINKWSLFIK